MSRRGLSRNPSDEGLQHGDLQSTALDGSGLGLEEGPLLELALPEGAEEG